MRAFDLDALNDVTLIDFSGFAIYIATVGPTVTSDTVAQPESGHASKGQMRGFKGIGKRSPHLDEL